MGTVVKIDTADHLVFFDGVCNLCNSSVLFIIKRDSQSKFRFAPLQSTVAEKIIGTKKPDFETILLFENGKLFRKSTAALKIARQLDGAWPLLYVFIVVPPFIRDFVYDLIAKNRYKWFGKQDRCMIPTPELKARFLDTN